MLTLFHDYTSPASAVAVARLQRLADEGLPVEFTSFEAYGVDVALPVTLDVLATIESLTDVAESEGVVLHRPALLPPTAPAHAVEQVAEAAELGASWRQTVYRAFWVQGADLADHEILRRLAAEAGLDEAAVEDTLTDRRAVAALRRRCAALRRQGIGGVPTILASRSIVPGLLDEADLRALAEL